MKIKRSLITGVILIGLSTSASADLYYSQNFDGMGTLGTTMPAGWSYWYIPGSSASLTLPTPAEMATALDNTGTLAIWNQTSASTTFFVQAANMGSTASDPNRLLGTSPTSVMGDILQLSLVNTSGGTVTAATIGYSLKCMASGTLKDGFSDTSEGIPGYRLYYLDGSTWTHSGIDLANYALNSVGTISGVVSFSTPIPNGGTISFRWYDDDGNAWSPDFMYGLDDVIVAIPEPGMIAFSILGFMLLIARRPIA